MSKTPEQFAAANKAVVDALLSVANTALASAERVAALNLNTVRSALEDGVANTKSLLGVKDVQEFVAVQASLAQPNVEKAVAYSRSVYEISADAQKELAKVVEAQFNDFQKSVAGLVDQATSNAPAGSEVAIAALKSAFAAASTAFDSMNKSAKQFADVAETNIAANMSAAADATVKAVGKAAAGTRKK